jgi:ribose 5-phosphate isomerase B
VREITSVTELGCAWYETSMNVAIGSDGKSHLTDTVVAEVKACGHTVEVFGALKGDSSPWPKVAYDVAEKVASGKFDQAILFCWTGTGISMAANKVPGIRAALCHDAETAKGARVWNNANILALSLRSLSEEVAKEILKNWFCTPPSDKSDDKLCFDLLSKLDKRQGI